MDTKNRKICQALIELDCFCSGLHQSMIKMMIADSKVFICYWLWMIMLCQIIQSCLAD